MHTMRKYVFCNYVGNWVLVVILSYNWTYFYNLSVIRQVAKVEMAQFTISKIIYICNSCNSVTIIMQLNKEQCDDMAITC
jgi:hypothetical protein